MKSNGDIAKPDPYAELYEVGGYDEEKLFKKSDVEAVDYLVRISRGKRDTVKTEKDWVIIGKVFEFWTRRWPNEWAEYVQSIQEIRATRLRKDGKSPSGEIKYVGALPLRFERMIKAIFPEQQFDKGFVYKLTNRIKITKVGEKHDTWFVI